MSFLQRCSAVVVVVVCTWQVQARADAVAFVQEPYGPFGAINPTGHVSVYLSRVCAESPVVLRRCRPGEFGVVLSRYYKIRGYDWIAVPLIPYLYAVEGLESVPEQASAEAVAALRDEYRRKHLLEIAPDPPDKKIPKGAWVELVGVAYDRKLYGFQVETTEAQDDNLIAVLNTRKNKSHFNLFFNNCADFSRRILNLYYPGAIRRNYIADAGMTTPQQIVKCLLSYAKHHPSFSLSSFFLLQVAGSRPPSRRLDGVSEGFVRSQKYIIPLAVFHPWVASTILTVYLAAGRFSVAHYVTTMYTPQDLSALQDSSVFRLELCNLCPPLIGFCFSLGLGSNECNPITLGEIAQSKHEL